jgi:chromosome segregation ATPase
MSGHGSETERFERIASLVEMRESLKDIRSEIQKIHTRMSAQDSQQDRIETSLAGNAERIAASLEGFASRVESTVSESERTIAAKVDALDRSLEKAITLEEERQRIAKESREERKEFFGAFASIFRDPKFWAIVAGLGASGGGMCLKNGTVSVPSIEIVTDSDSEGE